MANQFNKDELSILREALDFYRHLILGRTIIISRQNNQESLAKEISELSTKIIKSNA